MFKFIEQYKIIDEIEWNFKIICCKQISLGLYLVFLDVVYVFFCIFNL